MSDMRQLAELDAKARQYLDLKMAKIPSRVAQKPNMLIFYTADAEAIYVDGIPANIQLEYILEHYDDLKTWNFRVFLPLIQKYELSRALWYWQIDDTHSFSHKHESVRYNIITMSLVCGSENHIQHCDTASREFAWSFIMAWINSLVKHDDFEPQEAFLKLWRSSGIDLMTFSRSQLALMRKRLANLKSKVLPRLPFKIEDFIVNGQQLNIDTIKEHGAAIALQWCLSQEFFGHNAEMDIRAEHGEAVLDNVMGQLGFNEVEPEMDLRSVDWDWPPLRALIKDPDPDNVTYPAVSISQDHFWFSPSKAIDLMGTGLEQAEEMLQKFNFGV